MKEKLYRDLLDTAKEASKNSYSPYSGFAVGAAVLAENGKVYTGTNIENASYGLTNCAERTAIFTAVSDGAGTIKAVAVWNKNGGVFPCGSCRQVIAELAPRADIIVNDKKEALIILQAETLMPFPFGAKELKK